MSSVEVAPRRILSPVCKSAVPPLSATAGPHSPVGLNFPRRINFVTQLTMANTKEPRKPGQPAQKFSSRLLKFVGTLFGLLVLAGGFAWAAASTTGFWQWTFGIIAVLLLGGMALWGNAYSAEVQRKLGPLPLGKEGQDLKSLPLTKEWREQRSAKHG